MVGLRGWQRIVWWATECGQRYHGEWTVLGYDEGQLKDISQTNKRSLFVHVAASMGGHDGKDSGAKDDMSDEEENNHVIDLPDDDFGVES